MSLQFISPIELNGYWELMEEPIKKILDDINKDIKQEYWLPSDVFMSIKVGESSLFWGDDCFVVLQIRQDKYSPARKCFVWVAYSYEPTKNVMEETLPEVQRIAKEWGCQFLEFSTIRKGFAKRAIELGYSAGPSNYIMRV